MKKQDETAELKDKELEQASAASQSHSVLIQSPDMADSGGDVWAKGGYAYLGTFSR